jgi:hypothetical protein
VLAEHLRKSTAVRTVVAELEVSGVAALIEYVCTAQHDVREEPAITLEQGSWAYCSWGAGSRHEWIRIDPTPIEALRFPAGSGRARTAASTVNGE